MFAIAAVLLWSTVASAFKIALRDMHYIQLLWISSGVSAAVLLIALFISGKIRLIAHLSVREFLYALALGLLNPFLYYIVLFRAYELLPAQVAQPLNYTWPLLMALMAIPFLKQPLGIKGVFAILISFSGVVLISLGGKLPQSASLDIAGIALVLGSAVIWASYWLFTHTQKTDVLLRLCLGFFFGFICSTVLAVSVGEAHLPSLQSGLAASYVGLFEMGITFLLWAYALKQSTSAALISNLIYVVPFLSLIVIHFVVGEKIAYSSWTGCALIIAGLVVHHRRGLIRWK